MRKYVAIRFDCVHLPIYDVFSVDFFICNYYNFPFLIYRDGTSVILSDDVGQLYIINTGQGEYQMDAKYDQVLPYIYFSFPFVG